MLVTGRMQLCMAVSGAALMATGLVGPLADQAQAQAQIRNLDRAASDVRVYSGTVSGAQVAEFDVTLAAGEALRIDVDAAPGSSLDPYLRVSDRITGEMLAENDDGPNGLSARALVYSPVRRNLRLEVMQAPISSADASGAFEMSLRPSAWRPQAPRTIANGADITGTLTSGERHLFTLEAQPGEMWNIALNAVGEGYLDPVLELYRGTDAEGTPLAEDDDGGEGTNSRLRFAVTQAGTYTVAARALGTGEGGYRLIVGDVPVTAAVSEPLAFSIPVAGVLTGGESTVYRLDDSVIAALRSQPGILAISMETLDDMSDAETYIDPFLELGFETPVGFATLRSDDDGGEGLNALLTIDLTPLAGDAEMLGMLRIKASSVSSASGAYTITLARDAGFIRLP